MLDLYTEKKTRRANAQKFITQQKNNLKFAKCTHCPITLFKDKQNSILPECVIFTKNEDHLKQV